jgi:membrane associated rhomboid family serine protease
LGVEDRDYMRPGRSVPHRFRWPVAGQLVVLMVAAYFVQRGVLAPSGLVGHFLLSMDNLLAGKLWTVLTAQVMHADARHLLYNLIGLWFFGRLVEQSLGGGRTWLFCLVAALVSHVPWLLEQVLTGADHASLGASGIVLAALVFAAFRFPEVQFLLFFFVPVRLWVLAVIYVGLDVYGLLEARGPTNHWAHLGGAAYGFLAHRYGLVPEWPRRGAVRRPPAPGRETRRHEEGPFVRTEVDRLLDKIARDGIQSLSEEEREFLKRASSRYR